MLLRIIRLTIDIDEFDQAYANIEEIFSLDFQEQALIDLLDRISETSFGLKKPDWSKLTKKIEAKLDFVEKFQFALAYFHLGIFDEGLKHAPTPDLKNMFYAMKHSYDNSFTLVDERIRSIKDDRIRSRCYRQIVLLATAKGNRKQADKHLKKIVDPSLNQKTKEEQKALLDLYQRRK